jgi:hypothetical protein
MNLYHILELSANQEALIYILIKVMLVLSSNCRDPQLLVTRGGMNIRGEGLSPTG